MRYLALFFLLTAQVSQAADTKIINSFPDRKQDHCVGVACNDRSNNLEQERRQERERFDQIRRDQEFNDRNRDLLQQQLKRESGR